MTWCSNVGGFACAFTFSLSGVTLDKTGDPRLVIAGEDAGGEDTGAESFFIGVPEAFSPLFEFETFVFSTSSSSGAGSDAVAFPFDVDPLGTPPDVVGETSLVVGGGVLVSVRAV